MDSSLIHQQLFCTPCGICGPLFVSFINNCFIHHLVWISSSFSSIKSCFVHHLVCAVLHGSHPPAVVSYIIWYDFIILHILQQFFRTSSGMASFVFLIHKKLFCTSSDMSSPSLVSSINSCFLHHMVWIVLSHP